MSKLFQDYAGVSLAQATQICEDNNLDFDNEFMLPFISYQNSVNNEILTIIALNEDLSSILSNSEK